MKTPTKEAKKKTDEINNLFFIGLDINTFDDIALLLEKENDYSQLLEIYKQNIVSVANATGIPFTMAMHFSMRNAQSKIGIREAIIGVDLSEEEIRSNSQKKFNDALNDQEFANEIFIDLSNILLSLVKENQTLSKELLSQGYLQAWSIFEVFLRDFIELYLNNNPEKCNSVLQNDALKRRNDLRKIPYDFIESNMFDIKNKIGTLIVNTYDCSDLIVIKEIIKSIAYKEELNLALDGNELWKFFQTRHLLIHKKGIIDSNFLRKTNCTNKIGTAISITPKDFENAIEMINKIVFMVFSILC